MSLREAVQTIADRIDDKLFLWKKEGVNTENPLYDYLANVLTQLRIVHSASADEQPKSNSIIPEPIRKVYAERAVRQADEAMLAAAREESGSFMAVLAGTDNPDIDGIMLAMESSMPVGAKTLVSGRVFVLESDRRTLRYSKEETDILIAQRKSQ